MLNLIINSTKILTLHHAEAGSSLPTAQILDLWCVRWFSSPGHNGLDLHGSGSVSLHHALQCRHGQEEMVVLCGRPGHTGLNQAGAL